MALQQHRSRHPVDALAALLALDAARNEGTLGSRGRQPLVDERNRQARFVLDPRSEAPGRGGLRAMGAVEAQREADDDSRRLVRARDLCDPGRQGVMGICREGLERLSNGLRRVAQGQADALGSRVDRQDSQRYGDGVGAGLGDAVVVGGGAFDSTT